MIKLGVMYGGKSTEHEVSIKSAKSVIENLNKEKYEIFPIFIGKDGTFYKNESKDKIENVFEYLKNLDLVFPVLHGLYGEDGTIQGMFELLNIKYVGCKVLASSVGMDKAYSKIVFEKARINQAKYMYLKKISEEKFTYIDENLDEKVLDLNDIVKTIEEKLKYPIFVKPSNSGSSVGVTKSQNSNELIENIKIASNFDNKILVEEGILGREIECAVLGKNLGEIEVSDPGEIIAAGEFYSFDSKYNNANSKTIINTDLNNEIKEQIKTLAVKAFKAIDGNGLARVDFFVQNNTNKVYINEINTMPGFTEISMYPKLFISKGYTYCELLDKIIEISL